MRFKLPVSRLDDITKWCLDRTPCTIPKARFTPCFLGLELIVPLAVGCLATA